MEYGVSQYVVNAVPVGRNEDSLDLDLSHINLGSREMGRVIEEGEEREEDRDHCVSPMSVSLLVYYTTLSPSCTGTALSHE